MPARASHLPNAYERNALQESKIGELPGRRIGTASVIAKLLAKGWINTAPPLGLIELPPLELKHCERH
jgi:hypothetical protein